MEAIEKAAFVSVGRACGFTGLAILCVLVGLSFDPFLAARTGGTMTLAMTLFLGYRARTSRERPFRVTETWLILSTAERPNPAVAQQLIGAALEQAYVWFARKAAMVTVVLWTLVILLPLLAPA